MGEVDIRPESHFQKGFCLSVEGIHYLHICIYSNTGIMAAGIFSHQRRRCRVKKELVLTNAGGALPALGAPGFSCVSGSPVLGREWVQTMRRATSVRFPSRLKTRAFSDYLAPALPTVGILGLPKGPSVVIPGHSH